MSRADALRVVAYVAGFDARVTATPERVAAWQDALEPTLTAADAIAAVKVHYRTESRTVLPSDVNRLAAKRTAAVSLRQLVDMARAEGVTKADLDAAAADIGCDPQDRRAVMAAIITARTAVRPADALNPPHPYPDEGPTVSDALSESQEVAR